MLASSRLARNPGGALLAVLYAENLGRRVVYCSRERCRRERPPQFSGGNLRRARWESDGGDGGGDSFGSVRLPLPRATTPNPRW